MADGMKAEPRAVEYAVDATRRAGMEPKLSSIRGGTDGSQLTAKGLPTPNLSTGEHNPHSPLEWTCLEEMAIGRARAGGTGASLGEMMGRHDGIRRRDAD